MATNLWGNVYYKDTFASVLSQEAGGRCVFTYDEGYPQYQTLALGIAGTKDMRIGKVAAKNMIRLGKLFGLPDRAVMLAPTSPAISTGLTAPLMPRRTSTRTLKTNCIGKWRKNGTEHST